VWGEPLPFRCPRAGAPGEDTGDDVDHVLRVVMQPGVAASAGFESPRDLFLQPEPNPFIRYRWLLHSHAVAMAKAGEDAAERVRRDQDFVALVERLDRAVAAVDGRGFRETPFEPADELAASLGLEPGKLWLKDETGNVSGSHKGRHLMGLMLWLELHASRALQDRAPKGRAPLGIASCGNAALAAAVVAKAAEWPLEVFVPPDANPRVLERLRALDAELHPCPRVAGEAGDPCVHRFHEALAQGVLPFTCQGNENGLVIDGGKTLVWEMVARLHRDRRKRYEEGDPWATGSIRKLADRVLIQVGGGALASACFQGLMEALALGLTSSLPKIHAVQTEGASPLHRAWRQVIERTLRESGIPEHTVARMTDSQCARWSFGLAERHDALDHACRHRSEFMWPWESEPRSLATGILDDETYDWFSVVEAMVLTGGWPLVVSEETLAEAHRRTHEHTDIPADPTGTAGLAGLLHLQKTGESVEPKERIAVLMTGVER